MVKYEIKGESLELLAGAKKLNSEKMLVQFPGKKQGKKKGDVFLGIGGIARTTEKGEQLSCPVVFNMDEKGEYEAAQVVVGAPEFFRAVELAKLSSDSITIKLGAKLEVSGGATKTTVAYTTADKATLPPTITVTEPPVTAFKLNTAAFLRRLKKMKALSPSDGYVEFREVDGELLLLPTLSNTTIAFSTFDKSEYEKQTESPIAWVLQMRYTSVIEGMKLGKDIIVKLYERGFVLTSYGSTLIGSLPEMAGKPTYNTRMIQSVKQNEKAAFDSKMRMNSTESKKLAALLSLWAKDLPERNPNTNSTIVRLETDGKPGKLGVYATELLQYKAEVAYIGNIKPGAYHFSAGLLNKFLSSFEEGEISLIRGADGKFQCVMATGMQTDETGNTHETGEHYMLLGCADASYDKMCAGIIGKQSETENEENEEEEKEE